MFVSGALNTAAAAVTGRATTVSLHTANPGTTGGSEVSGGGYARQPISWGPPTGGSVVQAETVVFSGPEGATVTHIGLWDGSTWLGGAPLTAAEDIGPAGAQLDNVTVTAANA